MPEHNKDVLEWAGCVHGNRLVLCYIEDVKVSYCLFLLDGYTGIYSHVSFLKSGYKTCCRSLCPTIMPKLHLPLVPYNFFPTIFRKS